MCKEKKILLAKGIVSFLFPFALCYCFCLIKGTNIFNLYVPASGKNDCLFYYKIVEGIINYGMPKGYFGYNESHAIIGSLAAWSPIIYLPWVIWAKIFGWSYTSAILSNIFYFSFAITAFVVLNRLPWKNIAILFTFCSFFTCIPFYLLNIQPEILISSTMIVYLALAACADRKNNLVNIVGMYIIAVLLILIRPYMIVLMICPAYYSFKKHKKKLILLLPVAITAFSIGGYFLCSFYFTSEYLNPLFDTELLNKVLTLQLGEAFDLMLVIIIDFIKELVLVLQVTFIYGAASGMQYILIFLLSIVLGVLYLKNEDKRSNKIINISYFISVCFLLLSILLLLHSALEGGRHLFPFVVMGLCILSMQKWNKKSFALQSGLVIVMLLFFIKGALDPVDISIPIDDGHVKASIDYWEGVFMNQGVELTDNISYENTIDWIYADVIENEYKEADFKGLFAVPKGMGINCCTNTFVLENFRELKSRYIAAPCGGYVDFVCSETEWEELGRTDKMVVYRNSH